MDERIQNEYDKLLEYCDRHAGELSEHMIQMSLDHQKGLWKAYRGMLDTIPISLPGKSVADFGCKYGHLIPLLVGLGCSEAIGIDAEDVYVRAGSAVFPKLFPNAKVLMSEDGYVPLQPSTVDLVIMNEVISHVNPAFLDTIWREMARILKPGGILYISDGNNGANAQVQSLLPELYEKWENGPDGVKTDRDVVMDNFRGRRAKLIRERHPDMSERDVDFLASNTSGLFGEYLMENVARYRATGELTLRPYQKGICPVNPEGGFAVMERAFHPVQLELALAEYGFSAQQPKPPASAVAQFVFNRTGPVGRAKDAVAFLRYQVRKARKPPEKPVDPEAYRYDNVGFQIVAVKQ